MTVLKYLSYDRINQSPDQYFPPDGRPEVALPEGNWSIRAAAPTA